VRLIRGFIIIGLVVAGHADFRWRISDGGLKSKVNRQSAIGNRQSADERVFRYNNLGIAYLEQYNNPQAIEQFKKAVALAPNFPASRINLAIAYYNAGQRDQALAELRAVEKLGAQAPQLFFMLGLIDKDRGNFDEAIRSLDRVLKIDPRDVGANYNLGALYARKNDHARAAEYYRKVIAVEPYNASARYGLAISLLRSGKREEGQQAMTAFQQLQKKDYATQIGQQYLEQGKYAEAIGRFEREPARGASPVTFVDVAKSAGIEFVHAAKVDPQGPVIGQTIRATDYSINSARTNLIPAFGSGAAFFDYDNDQRLDLYIVNCSPDGKGRSRLYRNNGNGTFADVTERAGIGFAGLGMGAVAGDYDNDGWVDLYVTAYGRNVLYHNNGNGTFRDGTAKTGVGGSEEQWSLSAAFVDFDHDGDLDLGVTNFVDASRPPKPKADGTFIFPDDFPAQSNQLYRNNGNGTFTEVAGAARLAASRSTGVVWADYNNSRDVDVMMVGYGGSDRLFSNNRDGTFREVTQSVGLGDGGRKWGASAGDFNKDGFPDLFIARADSPNLLFESQSGGTFKRRQIPDTRNPQPATRSWMGQFVDYDNDGYLDIFVINGGTSQAEAARQSLQLLRNRGDGTFQDVSVETGLKKLPPSLARGAAFGDYDNDGDVDVLVVQNGGRPWLLKNDGGNRNRWIKVDTVGVRSNKLGIGAKVEVKAGRLWQKVEVLGGSGYLSHSSTEVIIGLGSHKTVDSVRVLWPAGILQSELEVASNQPVQIKELDRKGTSCPILYAWDGQQYNFVTDFLGGCAIGYLEAPGVYNYPDTDEYIRVTGSQLKVKDGRYSLKMNNQLEEVIMIDQAKLLVIDHPAEVDVFPNERLMPAPPYPEFKIYAVKNARAPLAATDDKGNNILPPITRVDREYPNDLRLLPFKGYADEHSIILDLGQIGPQTGVVLLMTAWIDYADSTANLAASQAGAKLIPPFLQVPNANGEWETVIPNMGFPAGLPKTMVVDLTGKFLTNDFRVKITTSMRIYWDQILVSDQSLVIGHWSLAGQSAMSQPFSSLLAVTELRPSVADFGWRGYPKEYSPDGKLPLIYDYGQIDQHAPWKTFVGSATRYGDVTELLQEKDDMYVIMLHGDEIALEFDARGLPDLPNGWRRDFFVYADGFGKDMDINSARPDTIEPLPFHRMSAYPYPVTESYPRDERRQEYLRKYNTRRYEDPIEETDAKKARRRGGM
jgi:tetratricopeptide (TPR) repeat protein